MKTYTFKIAITDKTIYDYDSRRKTKCNYNPKINPSIFKAIRNIFERGVSGETNNIVRYFDIKESKIDKEITVTSDVFYKFNSVQISAKIIPMRKKDVTSFDFVMTRI